MSHYFLVVKCLRTMIFVPFSLSSFSPFLRNVIMFRVHPLSTPYMLASLAKLHPLSPCTFERKDKTGGRGHWHPTKHTHLCRCRYCWTKCTHKTRQTKRSRSCSCLCAHPNTTKVICIILSQDNFAVSGFWHFSPKIRNYLSSSSFVILTRDLFWNRAKFSIICQFTERDLCSVLSQRLNFSQNAISAYCWFFQEITIFLKKRSF